MDVEVIVGEVIRRTEARGGIVGIPAFAVGRAQELLYAIYRLKQRAEISNLPVFLNSPMAIDMTEIHHRYRAEHRLLAAESSGLCHVAKMVSSVEDSRALVARRAPAIIVSASGMATGGRVLHHLKALAPQARNTIVFAGFLRVISLAKRFDQPCRHRQADRRSGGDDRCGSLCTLACVARRPTPGRLLRAESAGQGAPAGAISSALPQIGADGAVS